jgi:hypothetical protein
MTDFPTPPPRRLPPEVRDRIREQVLPGLEDATRFRFPRSRGPLAVAAGVAILAAGAMIVTQSVDDGDRVGGLPFPATGPTTSTSAPPAPNAGIELDRCLGAVRSAGKLDEFPDRRLWRPVTSRRYRLVTITAAMADGKPIFCQTTPTSVTITDPNAPIAYAGNTRTGALLVSDEGIVAGVVDPSWPHVGIDVTNDGAGMGMGGAIDTLPGGLFIAISSFRPTMATIKVGPTNDVNSGPAAPILLPHPAAPAIEYLRDRPTNPPPDRQSDRARFLVECLAKSVTSVADPDSWQPGATVTVQGSRILLMRYGSLVGYCYFENTKPNRYLFNQLDKELPGEVPRPRAIDSTVLNLPNRGVLWPMFGAVPSGTARMTLRFSDDTTAEADVFGSTFMVAQPQGTTVAAAQVFDGAGTLLYQGPLD